MLPGLVGLSRPLILILVAAVDAAEARSLGQPQWRRTV
jgi:hypothetical protein